MSLLFAYRARRGRAATLGIVAIIIIGSYVLAQYIINDRIVELELIGVVIAICVGVVTILNNWRRGLAIFLIWLLFEDLFRKYLGNNMAIYFGKDVLVAIVYISFFTAIRKRRLSLFKPPFRMPLLLVVWLGIMQVFNPASPSMYFGLMGLKLFFFYTPLLFVGYLLFNSQEDLGHFFSLNGVLLLIIASLGIAQSILGHTFLNPEVIQDDIRELATLYRTSPLSGLSSYRPTSVFVSTGRFANFLIVGWLGALGFTGYLLLRQRRGRLLAFTVISATAGALLLSASRGAFMWGAISTVVFSVAFLWGAPWRRREVIHVLRAIQRTTLGIAVALGFLLFLFPEALQSRLAFYYETLSPTSSQTELVSRSWDYPIMNFLDAFHYERWPYGYGIGTSGLGTQYVTRLLHVKPINAGVESGFGAIVIEQGIVGLLLWIVMSVAIVFSAWRVVVKLRGSILFPIAFSIFWFSFLLFFPFTYGGIMAYEDFVLNAYLWLLLGVLFRLPELTLSSSPETTPGKVTG